MKNLQEFAGRVLELTRRLAVIPAPSGQEEERAAACRDWLLEQGVRAEIDAVGNVIVELGEPQNRPVVLLMAHTDIVFSREVPLVLRDEGDRLYCPGIGDDTVHVAMLLNGLCWAVEQLRQGAKLCDCALVFAANVCEEGEGNLRGCRALMRRYGDRLREVISFDSTLDKLHTVAVGSMRYRVTVDTAGGHSFRDFGAPNAIALLAGLIAELNAQPLPSEGVTTYNFGAISGGTTVNSIAAHASMLYEFRADRVENLRQMEAQFRALTDQWSGSCRLTVEPIGVRPCACGVPQDRMDALQRRVERAFAGLPLPTLVPASTDCNLPLSMGIPAICLGLADCAGAHTTEEYLRPDSIPAGAGVLLRLLQSYWNLD